MRDKACCRVLRPKQTNYYKNVTPLKQNLGDVGYICLFGHEYGAKITS